LQLLASLNKELSALQSQVSYQQQIYPPQQSSTVKTLTLIFDSDHDSPKQVERESD